MATYQGQQVRVIWAPQGLPPIVISEERAEGDNVTADFTVPERVTTTSRYGLTVHTTSTDAAGFVEVTLQASGAIAKRLKAIASAQEGAIASGSGVIPEGPIVVVGPDATKDFVSLDQAVLGTSPAIVHGDTAPNLTFRWTGGPLIKNVTGVT